MTVQKYEIAAKANPGAQSMALCCPVEDMLYGGARGGGKGMFLQLDWLRHAQACGGKARGLLLRRYLTDLDDFIRETKVLFPKMGWRFKESDKEWVGPCGSVLSLRYLEREEDAERYQGWNLSALFIDEIGQFKSPHAVDMLYATLRLPGVSEHILRLTANPGGAGHLWLKERYIDPSPPMTPFVGKDGIQRVYIPARLKDNPSCNTDAYRAKLRTSAGGRIWLMKAWLEGDWNVQSDGGVFDIEKLNEGEMPAITALATTDIDPKRARIDRTLQGWDTAFTTNTKNDESAGMTVGRDDTGRLWIVDLIHGRWHPGGVAKEILAARRKWMAWQVRAEGGPAGLSLEHLIDDARRDGEMIAFELVSHTKDKIAKNAAFAAAVNNGQVWMPKGAAWIPYLKEQLAMFSGKDGIPDDCFPAGTPVATKRGVIPIERVTTDDEVMTRAGWKPVVRSWYRGDKIVISRFGITATPDHKTYTVNRGWVPVDSLGIGDILLKWNEKLSCFVEDRITGIPVQNGRTCSGIFGRIICRLRDRFIETCGRTPTAQYQQGMTSTIRTGTSSITLLRIWSAFQRTLTRKYTALKLLLGTVLKGTLITSRETRVGSLRDEKRGSRVQPASNCSGVMRFIFSLSSPRCAKSVVQNIWGRCKAKTVLQNVIGRTKTGVPVPVYDLSVQDNHEFVAWGVLVHNCVDAGGIAFRELDRLMPAAKAPSEKPRELERSAMARRIQQQASQPRGPRLMWRR